jgi:hypothetical protein
MKAYQSPEILWQDVDLADILTTSPTTNFVNLPGSDNENTLGWWG